MADMKEETGINDWLKFFTSVLTLTLPIAQVFSKNPVGLYIGGDTFFLVSIIALIISVVITIAYLTNPYINIPLFWWQVSRYNEYLRRINPQLFKPEEIKSVKSVNSPIKLDANNLAFLASLSLVVCGMFFIKIGLDVKTGASIRTNEMVVLQSLLYIATITSATYSLVYVTHALLQRNKWASNREKRAEKAIALAKKMDGFDTFPKINFVGSWDDNTQIPYRFVTEVKISNRNYQIFTDADAQILMGVIKIKKD